MGYRTAKPSFFPKRFDLSFFTSCFCTARYPVLRKPVWINLGSHLQQSSIDLLFSWKKEHVTLIILTKSTQQNSLWSHKSLDKPHMPQSVSAHRRSPRCLWLQRFSAARRPPGASPGNPRPRASREGAARQRRAATEGTPRKSLESHGEHRSKQKDHLIDFRNAILLFENVWKSVWRKSSVMIDVNLFGLFGSVPLPRITHMTRHHSVHLPPHGWYSACASKQWRPATSLGACRWRGNNWSKRARSSCSPLALGLTLTSPDRAGDFLEKSSKRGGYKNFTICSNVFLLGPKFDQIYELFWYVLPSKKLGQIKT